jgi:hypothetical protein
MRELCFLGLLLFSVCFAVRATVSGFCVLILAGTIPGKSSPKLTPVFRVE